MACENRTSPDFLIDQLETKPYTFDFFEALRLIEAMHADKPRLGQGVKASDDAVRLSQEPDLQFYPATLSSYSISPNGIPRLSANFFGLFGPHGPLPLHITDYARERIRNHHDRTLARFADIFHHRMISLFYRAWANVRPTVSFDRPESDRFSFYVGSMFGLGGDTIRNQDALSDQAKFFYAGHFSAQTKCVGGLQAIIGDVLRISVYIEEFVGEWMQIQENERSRLGESAELSSLGQSALLGAFVWGCQHKFRLVLGPLSFDQYLSLLPAARAFEQLKSIVRNYIGDEMVWDIKLVLHKQQVPEELILGIAQHEVQPGVQSEAQLGWTTWLGPRLGLEDADDLTLNPFFDCPFH